MSRLTLRAQLQHNTNTKANTETKQCLDQTKY